MLPKGMRFSPFFCILNNFVTKHHSKQTDLNGIEDTVDIIFELPNTESSNSPKDKSVVRILGAPIKQSKKEISQVNKK